MAFVRWRGNCAELLTTVYENGKSRQILLANLPQDYASDWVREQVAKEHPDIRVDWLAVERALAHGPKAKPTPEPPLTLLQAENLLRTIVQELRGDGLEPWQANLLNQAADILSSLHSDPRLAALHRVNPVNLEPSRNATLSSDDSARPPPPRGAGRRRPRVGAPSRSPEQKPRAEAPSRSPEQKPRAEAPSRSPEQKPRAEAPSLKPPRSSP